MKLSVPFIPDEGYAQFLSKHASSLSSIYFPLPSGPVNEGVADGIKLGGRTRGVRFLKRCISAYVKSSFNGNLLDRMDTPKVLARQWHIDTIRLGTRFFATLTSCTKICKPCRICSKIFNMASWKKEITFKSYKEFQ